jgi:hypothetical protein
MAGTGIEGMSFFSTLGSFTFPKGCLESISWSASQPPKVLMMRA